MISWQFLMAFFLTEKAYYTSGDLSALELIDCDKTLKIEGNIILAAF